MANVTGSAASAAAVRKQRQREEEEMTSYSPEDLNQYEFKIVRANWGVFKDPIKLDQLRQEEAGAGWELVEKFDNQRVRFKRPVSVRQSDNQLPPGINPYRSHFGMSTLLYTLLLVGITLLMVAVIYAVVFGLLGTFLAYNVPH
jgi:hypothetical protein